MRHKPKLEPSRATSFNSRGFALVELSIAMAVLGVIVTAALAIFFDEAQTSRATRQGEILKSYTGALFTYQTVHYQRLLTTSPATPAGTINGVNLTNVFAPTFDNLVALGLIPGGATNSNLYDGTYVFQVNKLPANCNQLSPVCELVGVVALSNSIRDWGGNISYARAGQIAVAAGDAGTTTLAATGTLTGPNGSWTYPHPSGNVPAGVGVRTALGQGGLNAYLRLDGQSTMTGNLNMGNQNINNASQVNANAVTTTTLSAQSLTSNTGSFTGALNTTGITNNGALNTTGAVSVTGNVSATGTITSTLANGAGPALTAQGTVIADDFYIASRQRWLSQLLPSVVILETNIVDLRLSAGNPNVRNVTKPNCAAVNKDGRNGAAGNPRIYAFPVTALVGSVTDTSAQIVNNGGIDEVQVDNSRLALGSYDVQVTDLGGSWRIGYETLPEANGTTYNDQALILVQIGCSYN